MIIAEIEQQTQDFDWFAMDRLGFIGHFMIGGHGALPASVAKSRADLNILTKLLLDEAKLSCKAVVDEGVLAFVRIGSSADAEARYFQGFIEAAERGLFSYDAFLSQPRPTGYYRVAVPVTPLHFSECPQVAAQILQRTKLDLEFKSATQIGAEMLLSEPGALR